LTLQIYAYGSRGSFREVSPTEPSLGDFLSYPAVETSHEQPVMRTQIGGEDFLVVKLREIVLVPLKTGSLTVGPMKAVLRGAGRGYPARGSQLGTLVESQPVTIEVTQPPEERRPADYQLGDVGRFALSATLTPKQLTAGDFASLRVQIRGTGNIPASVHLPDVPSVVWGTPTVSGELEVQNGDLAGSRLLTYTPQFTTAGDVAVGELRLPFYDPEKRRYRVARVDLGTVTVSEASPQGNSTSPAIDAAADARLAPRTALGPYHPKASPPPTWAFVSLAAAPASVWVLQLLVGFARSISTRQRSRKRKRQAPSFRELHQTAKSGDLASTAKSLERIGYELIENRLGLKGRGVLRSHLAAELQKAGLDTELASEIGTFFVRLENVRYEAATTDGASASALADAGEALLRRLDKAPVERRQRGSAKLGGRA
jgi:hypothetical protein